MKCTDTRTTHDHQPSITVSQSGSGAHLVDRGDAAIDLWIPIGCGTILAIIASIIGFNIDVRLGIALLVVIGIGTAYFFIQRWRVVRALCPGELFVQQWPLRRNETIRVRYLRLLKTVVALEKISARVECTESATYQQGTSSTTVTEIFYASDLEEVEREIDQDKIQADWNLTIPAEMPPSLDVYRNEVNWKVIVSLEFGDIPNDDSDFQLLVGPEELA